MDQGEPKARQAKSKARFRAYEELVAEAGRDKTGKGRSPFRQARGSATW